MLDVDVSLLHAKLELSVHVRLFYANIELEHTD